MLVFGKYKILENIWDEPQFSQVLQNPPHSAVVSPLCPPHCGSGWSPFMSYEAQDPPINLWQTLIWEEEETREKVSR